MKRFFAVCGGLLAVLLLAVGVRAEEVKNEFFILDLPSGWTVVQDDTPKGAVNIVAVSANQKDMLSVAVTPAPASLKEICTQVCEALKASGISVSDPIKSGDSYVVEFSQGAARGRQYFTSNGKLASAVSLMGDGGKEIMKKHFKPVDPKLFPKSY